MEKLFFDLIRSEILDEKITPASPSAEDLRGAYEFSKTHDLGHLTAEAILKNFSSVIDAKFKGELEKSVYTAIYRYKRIEHELGRITELFSENKIPHVLLKGILVRKYYPKPYMRTSCDIDILVKAEDIERARELLISSLDYKFDAKSDHDVAFFTPTGLHFEMHYSLIETDVVDELDAPLLCAWDECELLSGEYTYTLKQPLFYYYHIAHMAKHYVNGGCGIRPLIDLYFLDTKGDFTPAPCEEILKKGGILTFCEAARKLSGVWLLGREHSDLTRTMEEYILHSGVYGTMENKISTSRVKKGGARYVLGRIFMPYSKLIYTYPSLEGRKILTPIYEIRRWLRIIFSGRRRAAVNEVKSALTKSEGDISKTEKMLNDLGFKLANK